ncbi:MAG: hypothetical protein HY721_10280 [Planctomycetes bacterium]|nr:hypothetical protein [Planctomycetota bacterium]
MLLSLGPALAGLACLLLLVLAGGCAYYHAEAVVIPEPRYQERCKGMVAAAIRKANQLGFDLFPWCEERLRGGPSPIANTTLELFGTEPRTRGHRLVVSFFALTEGRRISVDGTFGDSPLQCAWLYFTHLPRSSVTGDVKALHAAILASPE